MNKSRNWLLIAGISLPVVLLLVFVVFAEVARQVVDPPSYDLLISKYSHNNNQQYNVQLTYSVVKDRVQVYGRPNPYSTPNRLFRFSPKSGEIIEIVFDVPEIGEEGGAVVPVLELVHVDVSSDRKSPDGFSLVDGYQRGPGLIGEMFTSRRRRGFTLEKAGAAFHYDNLTDASYGSVQLVGWVMSDGARSHE